MYSSVHPHVSNHSSTHTTIHPLIHVLISPSSHVSNHSSTHTTIHPLNHVLISPSTHVSNHSSTHTTIHPLNHVLICPSSHVSNHSSTHTTIHPLNHVLICPSSHVSKHSSTHTTIHPLNHVLISPSTHVSNHSSTHTTIHPLNHVLISPSSHVSNHSSTHTTIHPLNHVLISPSTHVSNHSSTHTTIHPLNHVLISPSTHVSNHSSTRTTIHPLIHVLISPSTHVSNHSSTRTTIHPLNHVLISPSTHVSNHSYTHTTIHPLNHVLISPSTHVSNHSSTRTTIHLLIHVLISPSTHVSNHSSTHTTIHPLNHVLISPSTHVSNHSSTRTTIHPLNHVLISPSTHVSNHSSTHTTIHPLNHVLISPSSHVSNHSSTHTTIHPLNHVLISPSTHVSNHSSTHTTIHPLIHVLISPSTHVSNHSSTHTTIHPLNHEPTLASDPLCNRPFSASFLADTLSVPRWSPQIPRRDLGNSIKHRFSTKYWMSQTCTVCGKGMLFGLKCKNCKLKCHNKCTKEAPPCHLLIIHRGARLVRTESVPCDINNPLRKPPRYSDLHISQTLPKTNKISKDHIPVPYQPDSSSNPSSTTSSTPSSPAPPLPPSATPPSPLHPSPQCTRQQKNFNLPGTSMSGGVAVGLASCQNCVWASGWNLRVFHPLPGLGAHVRFRGPKDVPSSAILFDLGHVHRTRTRSEVLPPWDFFVTFKPEAVSYLPRVRATRLATTKDQNGRQLESSQHVAPRHVKEESSVRKPMAGAGLAGFVTVLCQVSSVWARPLLSQPLEGLEWMEVNIGVDVFKEGGGGVTGAQDNGGPWKWTRIGTLWHLSSGSSSGQGRERGLAALGTHHLLDVTSCRISQEAKALGVVVESKCATGTGDTNPSAPGHSASSDLESNVSGTETSSPCPGPSVCSGSFFLFLKLMGWRWREKYKGNREMQGMTMQKGSVQPRLREATQAPRSQLCLVSLSLPVKCDFQGLDHFLRTLDASMIRKTTFPRVSSFLSSEGRDRGTYPITPSTHGMAPTFMHTEQHLHRAHPIIPTTIQYVLSTHMHTLFPDTHSQSVPKLRTHLQLTKASLMCARTCLQGMHTRTPCPPGSLPPPCSQSTHPHSILEGNPLLQIEVEPTSEVRIRRERSSSFWGLPRTWQHQLMSLMTQRAWAWWGSVALFDGCSNSGMMKKQDPSQH
ncbi:hypothetical protein MC885_002553 [Smutsia gigantea]|nr:hypothetical protein MC885_002553 [Smutsia gigantea]